MLEIRVDPVSSHRGCRFLRISKYTRNSAVFQTRVGLPKH